MLEQARQNVVQLSENEYQRHVEIARDVLNEVYSSGRALFMLGYTARQIRILDSIYSAVRSGEAFDAQRNNTRWNFYIHSARFRNKYGEMSVMFPGNGDFMIDGLVDKEIAEREELSGGGQPFIISTS